MLDHALTAEAFAKAKDARLPINYEAAKTALAAVVEIDECKDWADKAAALYSYARQIKDDSMMVAARRVHGRAVRRVGELLNEIEASVGGRPKKTSSGTDGSLSPRRSAADEAGLSVRQQETAQRVARVPETDFEEQIESPTPPTVTELAEQGKQIRDPAWHKGYNPPADPNAFNDAIHFPGAVKYLLAFQWKTDAERMLQSLEKDHPSTAFPNLRADLKEAIGRLQSVLTLMEIDHVHRSTDSGSHFGSSRRSP